MKSAARLYAVQALFQMEAGAQSVDRVRREFETHRFGAEVDGEELAEGDADLFRQLLEGAVERQGRIDQMTDRALVARWPINRIDPTLRALFVRAQGEVDDALLGTVPRDDGSQQVTYDGAPLYRYSGDTAPGDLLGYGSGDVWYPVAPGGEPVDTAEDRSADDGY